MSLSPSSSGIQGLQTPSSGSSEFNAIEFLVRSILSRVATTTLVKVVKCTNSGGVSPVGFVDIMPLVNQVDGEGNAVPHGVIYRCPYQRIQGGANAVIIDPQPGDIGAAIFASRDISAVIANKGQANPASGRSFDMADALYLGGFLNGTPTQYVEFSNAGITITSPTAVTINAPAVTVNAPAVSIVGDTVFTGKVTANGHRIDQSHTHGGITPGGSSTAPVN